MFNTFSYSPSTELVSRAKMPQEERIGVGVAFQGSHLKVYTFLFQLIIAIREALVQTEIGDNPLGSKRR
jgi:hypothetical protein